MIEHFNAIDVYHKQIEALLDLMQCAGDSADMESIRTASEMSQTMLDELMSEVAQLEKYYKAKVSHIVKEDEE